MVKWAVAVYETLETLETAIELVDNTVNIHIIPILKDNREQYMLAVGNDTAV